MVWISYVVMVLLLYTPCLDWGKKIADQTIDLNTIIPTGYILLFVYSLLLWGIVLLLLWLLESSGIFPLFQKGTFRDGFLFALIPQLSNNIALALAIYIVVPPGLAVFLKLAEAVLVRTPLRDVALRAISFLTDLVNRIPVPPDHVMIVLGILTLIAAFGFKWEQRERYENISRQNQLLRKQELREMIVPSPR